MSVVDEDAADRHGRPVRARDPEDGAAIEELLEGGDVDRFAVQELVRELRRRTVRDRGDSHLPRGLVRLLDQLFRRAKVEGRSDLLVQERLEHQ